MFKDENGNWNQLKTATAEQKDKIKSGELEQKTMNAFKKGNVFDVSQTNATADDLPKIFPNKIFNFNIDEQNSLEHLQVGVKQLASHLNIEIKDMKKEYGELGAKRGAYLQYIDGRESIVLNSRNTETQNIAVSIHELAHKKLHNLNNLNQLTKEHIELGMTTASLKEFQAELVSYIVSRNYGMDTSEQAIPYIASWTDNATNINPKLL